ncbi:helix-turn-helix transcriptional regulator [Serratia sp. UGAL515B_01]|uniref:helix-turn-helix transcriptional regulator n=1 Tax=Serratia sp. UGAL515B_01 TaxID=2986763 RepID=UPI002953EA98|nr:helix-turn-helix transcriptional regulator [Serratia sp. UGAL515B_01]WON77469.1 helix-turn-helix transcriptional regulator [Serratia sp. UGAL515B_01]
MLSITVRSYNEFYKLGLLSILEKNLQTEDIELYKIVENPNSDITEHSNIIFTEQTAIINIFDHEKMEDKDKVATPITTIHIILNTSWLFAEEASAVVTKIITLAKLNYKQLLQNEFYRKMLARNSSQLSTTESRVVMLISQGYDIPKISQTLNCSAKTIYTHRRNAIKKLGMVNRLEFYKYIMLIKDFYCRENIFLSL